MKHLLILIILILITNCAKAIFPDYNDVSNLVVKDVKSIVLMDRQSNDTITVTQRNIIREIVPVLINYDNAISGRPQIRTSAIKIYFNDSPPLLLIGYGNLFSNGRSTFNYGFSVFEEIKHIALVLKSKET